VARAELLHNGDAPGQLTVRVRNPSTSTTSSAPTHVLVSSRTFSGGEDLCYTLQALGRAELIGETTA
jgi:C-terminal processing protease CtpA/Prc